MKAVITGGNKGIGLAISKLLILHGFEVHSLSRSNHHSTSQIKFWQTDIANFEQCATILDNIGEIDVFINNAGYMNTLKANEYTMDDINHILMVNMINAIRLSILVAEKMAKRHSGRIISMGSIAAEIGHPDIWYGISKAGLINAMRSIARIYGPQGVIANAIAPGPVETDMMQKIPLERQTRLKAATINQQFCSVKDIAETALWMATRSPASMNGEVIDLNNGVNYR